MTRFAALLLPILLIGCSTINAAHCPPVKEWTPEQNAQLGAELEAMPEGSITIDVIADYIRMRDQARLCKGSGG